MTSSVVGQRKSFKALPKAKLAPKKSHCHCLVVCCQSDPLQLFESWWNHYIWEVGSANRWDAPKTAVPQLELVNIMGLVLLHNITWPHVIQPVLQKLNKLGYEVLPHPPYSPDLLPTTWPLTNYHFLSILTTFCRENTSTTRTHKMLSETLWNPEAWIFRLQE